MQQVNLYVPELRPHKDMGTAGNCLLIVIMSVCIFAGMALLDTQSLAKAQKELEVKKTDAEGLKTLVDMTKNMSKSEDRILLEHEIEITQHAIDNRLLVKSVIERQGQGKLQPFSQLMSVMKVQLFDGFSISRFTYSYGGAFVEMSGYCQQPKDVPRYLELLRSTPSFVNSQFGLMSIEEADKRGRVRFTLGYNAVQVGGDVLDAKPAQAGSAE